MVALCAAAIECVRPRGSGRPPTAPCPPCSWRAACVVTASSQTTAAGTLRVGARPGKRTVGLLRRARAPNAVLQAQLDASAPLFGEDMDVLLWPEGGIDSDPPPNESRRAVLDALAERMDAPLLVSAVPPRGARTSSTRRCCGSRARAPCSLHDKRHPVPLGEYVPDRPFFEAVRAGAHRAHPARVHAGHQPAAASTSTAWASGLAICFDVIYDGVIWEGARDGAQVYMFQTNNADFRDTDENLQQLAFARMRAIETGRSVVNISTVGTSQVIAPDGTTIDALPAGEAGHMLTDVELRTGLTPAVIARAVGASASRLGEPCSRSSRSGIAVRAHPATARERRRPRRDRRLWTKRWSRRRSSRR